MIPAVVGVLLFAIVLVLIGLRRPRAGTTIQDRLLEYSTRAEAVSLEELELSQPFSQRVLVPMINGVARLLSLSLIPAPAVTRRVITSGRWL